MLKKGDTLRIISTARKITPSEVLPAIQQLHKWGYRVETGNYLFQNHHQFAGTDEQRTKDLQEAINDINVKAILCARGGYGTVRIIDKIDFKALKTQFKPIIGFSDVTVLLSHLAQLHVSSVHATMPILFHQKGNEKALHSLKNIFTGTQNNYTLKPHPFNKKGSVTAPIVGGNLSIINSLIGTDSGLVTTNKILFLEDLDEYEYHIDRMVIHLDRAGLLARLSGLIIGHMSGMNDNKIPFGSDALKTIKRITNKYEYPICFGFPVGHEADNRAIRHNEMATLVVKDEVVYFSN